MEAVGKEQNNSELKFATRQIHAGYSSSICQDRPVVQPIFLTTNYEYESLENTKEDDGFYYSRCGNRSRDILEKTLAALEEANYGLCFSSGMATIFSVVYLLNPGDHIICTQLSYGGTMHMMNKYTSQKGIDITFVDLTDLKAVEKAMKENTKMIYTESCCNPTLSVVDVEALASIAKRAGLLLVIDNTFITPYFQKPLKQGADIVIHSATKYLNGHGDAVLGILATNNSCLYEKLKDIQKSLGFVPSPFDCYMVSRGLQTLHLRMKEHMKNATAVAEYLESHNRVKRVLYPGLPSHPQHELAKKQFSGYGGVVGFYVNGGEKEVENILTSLKLIKLTGSLGQPYSLISYPAKVSHAQLNNDERRALGVTDNYIRFAVGLEDIDDIIKDLEQAFKHINVR